MRVVTAEPARRTLPLQVAPRERHRAHIEALALAVTTIVIAFGLPIIAYGLIFNLWLCALGGLITGGGIFGFALEPPDDPDAHGHHDDHDDHGGEDAAPPVSEIEEASHG